MDIISKIIDINYRPKFKFKLLIPLMLLIATSLVLLNFSNIDKQELFYKQLNWVGIGCFLVFLVSYVRLDFIYRNSYKFYVIFVILLIMTIIIGVEINYSKINFSQRSWLHSSIHSKKVCITS